MARRLEDKVVVITGASGGIGRATALEFARLGASVVLAARREDALRRAAKECERLGGRAIAVRADTADEAQVDRTCTGLALEQPPGHLLCRQWRCAHERSLAAETPHALAGPTVRACGETPITTHRR